jgi:hypothetical protein
MVKSGFAFAADCSIRLNGATVMRSALLTLPEVALIAATRGMLGAGIGLLVAPWLNEDRRRAAGWTLLLIGALSTIPLAMQVFGKRA